MKHALRLAIALDRLEAAYEARAVELEDKGFPDPLLVRDSAGRSVLGDMLVTLVNGYAVLARIKADS